MERITWTDLKNMGIEEVKRKLPLEITFNCDVVFKVVPTHWRDPRFVAQAAIAAMEMQEK